jgi:hypothetical protein
MLRKACEPTLHVITQTSCDCCKLMMSAVCMSIKLAMSYYNTAAAAADQSAAADQRAESSAAMCLLQQQAYYQALQALCSCVLLQCRVPENVLH